MTFADLPELSQAIAAFAAETMYLQAEFDAGDMSVATLAPPAESAP